MKKCDLIMRHADFKMGEKDNKDVILLKEEFFANTIQVELIASDILKRIMANRNNWDQSVVNGQTR